MTIDRGRRLRSAAPVDLLNATVSLAGLTGASGVAFGPHPRQRLDVYRPAADGAPLPVIVFFYGGSWQGGRREEYLFIAAALARRGMLVMVPDYRVFPEVRFPGFLEDSAAAVAFARREAPTWGGDPDRLFVMGHSAGAYNAAMLALDPRHLAAVGDSRDRLAGMIGLAGPYDFLPFLSDDIRAIFAAPADPRETQPVNYVDGHAPPLLLLHGDVDDICYPRNSLALALRVRAAGGSAQARIYPGVGHVGIVLGFAPLFRWRSPALADVATFVRATLAARESRVIEPAA